MKHKPSLSVVVAVSSDSAGLVDCLESLVQQEGAVSQILVVSSCTIPQELRSKFPTVAWHRTQDGALVPALWSYGISQADGDVVAITTSHFVPASDWGTTIVEAHARLETPAIGGTIKPPPHRSARNLAVYFLRYSQYLGYHREQVVADLAGDNASYRRDVLREHPTFLRKGFWEHEYHRQLRSEGALLVFAPQIAVTQRVSPGVREFAVQRFRHGLHYGRNRAASWSLSTRLCAILASPFIPVVVFAKITRRVLRHRQHLGSLLYAFPFLGFFLLTWSLGEALGYITSSAKNRPATGNTPGDALMV